MREPPALRTDSCRCHVQTGEVPARRHEVPPLRNALMRKMFMRRVKDARGPGTMLGKDGLLISLPKGSKDINTKQFF